MTLPEISIRRHVFAWMISFIFILFGYIGYQKIGVDRFPMIEFPVLSVTTTLEGANPEGWVQINSDEDLQLLADLGSEELTALGTANISLINNEVQIILDTPFDDSDLTAAYAIEVRPASGGTMSTTCWENYCANIEGEDGAIANTFNGFTYNYPFYVRIETINCFNVNLLD